MFPIGDSDVKEAGLGWITIGLVAVNVLVFFAEATVMRSRLDDVFQAYGVVPARVVNGEGLYAFVTSLFLHGGWLHIISNMVFLWIFGDNVEAVMGKIGYPIFYVLGGIAASAAHVFVNPETTMPIVGASGAIGAVLGAYIVMFPRSQVRVLMLFGFFVVVRRVTAVIFLGVWFAMQFFSGVATLGAETAGTGGIAVWAHVGGFLFGLLGGLAFRGRAKQMTLEHEPRRRPRGRL